jgi:hypothetical protein
MWEYATVVVTSQQFATLSATLNEWGRHGWEAVGMAPVEWATGHVGQAIPNTGVLLKRRIPEQSGLE